VPVRSTLPTSLVYHNSFHPSVSLSCRPYGLPIATTLPHIAAYPRSIDETLT
jgi:hypothetical protein